MSDQRADLFDDEGAGYLVSVSDIMAGLLFVFIITLVAFIIQFNEAKQTQERKIEELTNNQEIRTELLEEIKRQLKAAGIPISVSPETGVLRLTKNAVPFARGEAEPLQRGEDNLETIAEVLGKVIPCYAHSPPDHRNCQERQKDKLEAVFIEGHTDSTPIPRPDYSNWNLSSDRAINSYRILKKYQPVLEGLENSKGQPLFSVSGYAARRPRTDIPNASSKDPRQRRIELRFIMTPPESPDQLQPIQELERQGVGS